jgi:hypothetical protein
MMSDILTLNLACFFETIDKVLSGEDVPEEHSKQLVELGFIRYLTKEQVEKHYNDVSRSEGLKGILLKAYSDVETVFRHSRVSDLEKQIEGILNTRQNRILSKWEEAFEQSYTAMANFSGRVTTFPVLYRSILSHGLTYSALYHAPSYSTDINRMQEMREPDSLVSYLKHISENSYKILISGQPAYIHKYDGMDSPRGTFFLRKSQNYHALNPVVDDFRKEVTNCYGKVKEIISACSGILSEYECLVLDLKNYSDSWGNSVRSADGGRVKSLINYRRLIDYIRESHIAEDSPISKIIDEARQDLVLI